MIGKSKVFHENFPKTLRINKTSIIDKNVIADKFSINLGSNLASKIRSSSKNFDLYLPVISTIFAKNSLTEEEFKKAFFFCWNLIAKVSPIFKNGEKDLLTNYRPISVLLCFAKILECIMYDRLLFY